MRDNWTDGLASRGAAKTSTPNRPRKERRNIDCGGRAAAEPEGAVVNVRIPPVRYATGCVEMYGDQHQSI